MHTVLLALVAFLVVGIAHDEITFNINDAPFTATMPAGGSPEAIAQDFVEKHGLVDGGGCSGSAACVAALLAAELTAARDARHLQMGAAMDASGLRLTSAGGLQWLVPAADKIVGRSLDILGSWEEPAAALMEGILRPGDLVVDVGANLGAHAVRFAKAVGP